MKTKPQSPVIKATVTTKQAQDRAQRAPNRAERDLIKRHQAALHIIDKLDAQRIAHPHVPQLANDVLRNDDVIDYSAPVMQAILDQAGPRTASHPMATRIDTPIPEPRPMATRTRPSPIMESGEAPDRWSEVVNAAASALFLAGCVLLAACLGSR